MYRRDDPRLRRTLNQLSQNLESANESAQAGLYTFTQNYIDPCISYAGNCFLTCTETCFPNRDERLRRNRGRSRGRAELSFDFYDDWENDENDGLLSWGNDGLDRLLAGTGGYGTTSQPVRERGMSYGIRRDGRAARRKSAVQPHDGGPDPTIIPSSSYFGFLGRLPWKLGGKGLRYRPSAADLREHPGLHRAAPEEEPLMEESGDDENESSNDVRARIRQHRRKRSETAASTNTTDSLSSRGDIFPSEDEIDDAIPLDDEFAMALERRTTGLGDESSGHASSAKRASRSRLSTRTVSSKSTTSGRRARGNSAAAAIEELTVPTLADLKMEEDRVQREEEADLERKRDAAQQLAIKRGLTLSTSEPTANAMPIMSPTSASEHSRALETVETEGSTPADDNHIQNADTDPFPTFDFHTASEFNALDADEPNVSNAETAPQKVSQSLEADEGSATEFIPAKLPKFGG